MLSPLNGPQIIHVSSCRYSGLLGIHSLLTNYFQDQHVVRMYKKATGNVVLVLQGGISSIGSLDRQASMMASVELAPVLHRSATEGFPGESTELPYPLPLPEASLIIVSSSLWRQLGAK